MKSAYYDIFKDIYKVDPKLKKNEKELIRIIKELAGSKPDIRIDENFHKELLTKLSVAVKQVEKKPVIIKIKEFFKYRKKLVFSFSSAFALLLIFAIGFIFFSPNGNFKLAKIEEKSVNEITTTTKLLPDSLSTNKTTDQVKSGKTNGASTSEAITPVLKSDKSKSTEDFGYIDDSQIYSEDLKKQTFESEKKIKEEFNTEEYDRIVENNFKNPLDDPLSTFSIDVDTASYSNIRRFLQNGELPYKDAVRIEEMINYFSYDYKAPQDDKPFAVNMELAECPWNKDNKLLLIGVQGKKVDMKNLPPNNLVFLIDVSGSMEDDNKLPLLKQSLRLLVGQMREQDHIAIVVYAGSSGVVLPSTSGQNKNMILSSIENLESGGSTAGGEGIMLAYKIAKENFKKDGNNRIILSTDGDFNVGASSDGELVRMIEEQRKSGVYLSILGYGMGNYKDSKMEKLADAGNGNYAYIDSLNEAKKVLVDQMGGTLLTIAKDVKIQIEFNPAIVSEYRLIGYENRMLNKEDFENDAKDAGEIGAGHTVTALYELVVSSGKDKESSAKSRSLKYQKSEMKNESYAGNEVINFKIRYKAPDSDTSKLLEFPLTYQPIALAGASVNLRWAASVAEFGMLLRDSEFKGSSNIDQVLELSKKSAGEDKEGYRKEFIDLVKKAKELMKK